MPGMIGAAGVPEMIGVMPEIVGTTRKRMPETTGVIGILTLGIAPKFRIGAQTIGPPRRTKDRGR